MRGFSFADLYNALDGATNDEEKIYLLTNFLENAPPAEVRWGLYLLCGGKVRRVCSPAQLRASVEKVTGLPSWLVEESQELVRDLAETAALLLQTAEDDLSSQVSKPTHLWGEKLLTRNKTAKTVDSSGKIEAVESILTDLPPSDRFLCCKLLVGAFRPPVRRDLILNAFSLHHRIDKGRLAGLIAQCANLEDFDVDSVLSRLSRDGTTTFTPFPFQTWQQLSEEGLSKKDLSKEGSSDIDTRLQLLGSPDEWIASWIHGGIRAQLVKQSGEVVVWSTKQEVLSDTFPELRKINESLPDGVVLDGEVFSESSKSPMVYVLYDILEHQGVDLRNRPASIRQSLLRDVARPEGAPLQGISLNEPILFSSWSQLKEIYHSARTIPAEGILLKHVDALYRGGIQEGGYLQWSVPPHSVFGVLLYVQAENHRGTSGNTEYTFAVWDGSLLIPFAKVSTGLLPTDRKVIDDFVRINTRERFGPVRTVSPKIVCEISFEGITSSRRHKSGVALRMARISKLLLDKVPEDAAQLWELRELLSEKQKSS